MKPGFNLAPGTARIVLMRPTIKVGAQSTGGMFEPNADWTAQGRENLGRAIAEAQGKLGNVVVAYEEPAGGAAGAAEYQALFTTVANSVMTYQFFSGNRLPTKKRKGQFEWGLGPGIGKVSGLQGADYALFVSTEDQFGSTGRKVLQVAAILAVGVAIKSGLHTGYAGLVDLKTGELVWLNADAQMGGDVRTPEGAARRAEQLFKGFPGSTPAALQVAGR
ncbi:MAG TPA: hypothetical protein VL460_03615 [Caulobacteraceae bacterium]|nr:hypothetical protein [Caulobacteraceae bacterium]